LIHSGVARKNSAARTDAVRSFLVLLLAAASVAMSYGVTLPLLPPLLRRLQVEGAAMHTGWLTAAYTLALFACSPFGARCLIGSTAAGSSALA
jgi:MFS family permease